MENMDAFYTLLDLDRTILTTRGSLASICWLLTGQSQSSYMLMLDARAGLATGVCSEILTSLKLLNKRS